MTGGLVPAIEAAFAGDPGRPAVTYYDDASGERVELSWTSLGNWAAKTANLLRFELGVQPGDHVGVALPLHWQTPAVVLGALWAGCPVVPADPDGPLPTDVEALFCPGSRMDEALAAGVPEVLGLSLAPMGARLGSVPPGALDYAVGVPGQADRWSPDYVTDPDDDVLPDTPGHDVAATPGLGAGHRVLTVGGWSDAASLVAGLLGPLLAGAGVVLCRRDDDLAALAAHAATEKVTHSAGVSLAGVTLLT